MPCQKHFFLYGKACWLDRTTCTCIFNGAVEDMTGSSVVILENIDREYQIVFVFV